MKTQPNATAQPNGQPAGAAAAAPASGNAAPEKGANGEASGNGAAQGGAGEANAGKGGEGAAQGGAGGGAAAAGGEAGKGAGDGKEKPPGAPEKYELTLAEKSPLPEARKGEIEKLAREKNWTNEQAQERIKVEEEAIARDRALELQALGERRSSWKTTLDNDARFKDEEGKARVEYAKRLIDECASPELKAILKPVEQGGQDLGNFPPLIDLVDTLVERAGIRESRIPNASAGATEKSHADILFKGHK